MRVIEPSVGVERFDAEAILLKLERAIRTCYKSEDRIAPGTAVPLVEQMISTGHHSTLEHDILTARFICDRGVTHELVRHRLAAYSQESTRYCNYGKGKFGQEITVIRPCFWPADHPNQGAWITAMYKAEEFYLRLIEQGAKPQEARSVLPNSLKTEIVTTANLREWRHIFKLRCGPKAHPQIRQIMLPLRTFLIANGLHCLFEDISVDHDYQYPEAGVDWAG